MGGYQGIDDGQNLVLKSGGSSIVRWFNGFGLMSLCSLGLSLIALGLLIWGWGFRTALGGELHLNLKVITCMFV